MPDLRSGVDDLEASSVPGHVVAHGEPGLPAPDDEDVQRWASRPGGHRTGSGLRATLKLNIMPLSVSVVNRSWSVIGCPSAPAGTRQGLVGDVDRDVLVGVDPPSAIFLPDGPALRVTCPGAASCGP